MFLEEIGMAMEFKSEWFAGWGTLALINAGLAQSKHRSGLVWFLLSLVLGPFATLVIVLLDDPKERFLDR
jgi:hypothetical protein